LTTDASPQAQRLNKLLSQAGVASRRQADELIRQGRVDVNGKVVTELGAKADPAQDEIRVDGRRLGKAPEHRYLLLNKPRGVVSSRSDPQRRPTVIDILSTHGVTGYFYPIGRLDFDSEGLLLLTNDGAFAQAVAHPRAEIERTYETQVVGVPDQRDLARLRRGILIDGRRTRPAKARVLRQVPTRRGKQVVLEIVLREGRNRQVRRMCDAIAHPVERLRRTRIGPVTDRRLRPGQIRDLTKAELNRLRKASAADGPDRPVRARRRPRARR
jgi:pseudouridine synthase